MPAKNNSTKTSGKWNFTGVSCGREHTLAVLENGSVFGWGGNGSGRLPSDLPQYCTSLATRANAVEIPTNAKMRVVAAGYGVSLGITDQHTVQVWGFNTTGIAGRLGAIDSVRPQLVPTLDNIKQISANEFQFAAVDQKGNVYTWGLNAEGALGRVSTQFNDGPGLIANVPPIQRVAVGRGHMLAIDEGGSIHTWGFNGAGQLGLGHLASMNTPQTSPQLNLKCKAIAAGTSHSLGLTIKGQVYAWGSNHHGQLGCEGARFSTEPLRVKLSEPIKTIAAGMHFSVAVGESGKVYAWGWNGHGQLGVSDTLDRHLPAPVKYLKNASAIAAGETHVVALTDNGLFGWGSNGRSQLGELERRQKFAARLL